MSEERDPFQYARELKRRRDAAKTEQDLLDILEWVQGRVFDLENTIKGGNEIYREHRERIRRLRAGEPEFD